MGHWCGAAALISVSLPSARHQLTLQLTLQGHRYGASISRGVPVYSPAFTHTHTHLRTHTHLYSPKSVAHNIITLIHNWNEKEKNLTTNSTLSRRQHCYLTRISWQICLNAWPRPRQGRWLQTFLTLSSNFRAIYIENFSVTRHNNIVQWSKLTGTNWTNI